MKQFISTLMQDKDRLSIHDQAGVKLLRRLQLKFSHLKPSTHLGSPVALSLTPDFFDASRLRLRKPENILDDTKNL